LRTDPHSERCGSIDEFRNFRDRLADECDDLPYEIDGIVIKVDVGGVTVSRATLHDESEVERKDLRPGDKVRVARAGDAIPEVVERVAQGCGRRPKSFEMPKMCPVCGAKIVREGAYVLCPAGLACRPQLVGHLHHFGSRKAIDIEGLGKETARSAITHGSKPWRAPARARMTGAADSSNW